MRKNAIPAVIAFAPLPLLPLVQDILRPRISHASWLGFVLSWAPDLVVGFCFPFDPRVRELDCTSSRTAVSHLLSAYSCGTAAG
jgi:hypothetical protein